MLTAILLAAIAGIVVGCVIWSLFAFFWMSMPKQKVYQRLKQIGSPELSQRMPDEQKETDIRATRTPGLNRLFRSYWFTAKIMQFLEQSGMRLSVAPFLVLNVVTGLLGFIFVSMLGIHALLALLLTGFCSIIPLLWVAYKRRQRFYLLTMQLPEAIRLVTSSMRAGLGLDSGLEIVANELPDPICFEFNKLLNERRLYTEANEAFRRFAERLPIRDYRLFAAAASLHREVGGNFAELLDQLEATVRSRFQLQRELKTLTAEGRLSGWILGVLPAVVTTGLILLNPVYFKILWDDPRGRVALWIAVSFQIIGFLLIRRMAQPRFE